ncbi:MAG: hypothetical protein EZS28_030598 [Streblomastix strix]|uniref:VWFA domain-containing protein n=1 Tax=Streblomastix strix TaxID=222440 RepID=A0A5J4UT86_9EUKA|nr:MAG: hypothetical protein EZS28_030598 [Streblomastix strix]
MADIQRSDGANFKAALQLAFEIFNEKLDEYKRRILLFTCNKCENDVSAECNALESMGVRIDVVGFGQINIKTLTKLIIGDGRVFVYDNMEEIIQIFKQMDEDNFDTEETVQFIIANNVVGTQSEYKELPSIIRGINTSWKKSDFTKEKWLGKGSFGSVQLVRHVMTKELMA